MSKKALSSKGVSDRYLHGLLCSVNTNRTIFGFEISFKMAPWQIPRHITMLATMLAVSSSLFQITSAAYLFLLGMYKRRGKYRQTALLSSLGKIAKKKNKAT